MIDATRLMILELRPPDAPRYQSLDFWRGVACLLVVVFHSTFYQPNPPESGVTGILLRATQWCWLGVPMFFVISGYCISASADRLRRKESGLGTYARRRFLRIYPPLWIFVALAAALVFVVEKSWRPQLFADEVNPIPPPWALNAVQWLGNLSLTELWRFNFTGGERSFFQVHFWTLCYEEQFYFIVGVILWLWPRWLFQAAALVTVLSVIARHVLMRTGGPMVGLFYDGQWVMFAAGIVVYWQVNYGRPKQRWLAVAVLLAGLVYSVRDPGRVFRDFNTDLCIFIACGFALLLLLLHAHDGAIASSAVVRPIAWCGTISYSLYLTHWPVVKALSHLMFVPGLRSSTAVLCVTVPVCIAASIAVAAVFYRLVERHFLSSRRQPVVAG